MSINRYRELKLRLIAQGKGCYWCGKRVQDYGKTPDGVDSPANEATIDHLESRFTRKKGQTVEKVLACKSCNQKRSWEEMKAYKLREI